MINNFKTKILTSIKSLNEISLVLNKGVDIVDFKNPLEGALGAFPVSKINYFLNKIPKKQKTSATIGDITSIKSIEKKVYLLSKTNVDFIKIGFFFDENKINYLKNLKKKIKNKKIIAVLFADMNPDLNIIKKIKNIGFDGILIDTINKKKGNLFSYFDLKKINNFIKISKKEELSIGLAGSLTINDIKPLILLRPNYLGFRGALCEDKKRNQNINRIALDRIVSKFRFFSFLKNHEVEKQLM
tara:strand:+ start:10866 stop:11594 length:729 start_codon:yes stop_codon:yes gene_type:complete